MLLKSPTVRKALVSLTFFCLYVALNHPGIIFLSGLGFTAWYPATGLSLALLLGVSPWFGFLVGLSDLLTSALIYHTSPLSLPGGGGAAGVTLCYSLAAYLLRGPILIDPVLRRRRDVVRYVAVTISASMASTMIGVSVLVIGGTITWSQFLPAALDWFLGDSIALLGVAPFLLIHVVPGVKRWLDGESSPPAPTQTKPEKTETSAGNAGSVAEGLGQIGGLLLVLWVMFGGVFGSRQLFFLSYLPIIWIAMRQGIRRTATGLLLFNFGIVLALHLYPVVAGTMSKIGLLMLTVSAAGLLIGSAVTERNRIAGELSEQTIYLNALIQNNPLGIAVLNQQGRVELTNNAFQHLFSYKESELAGVDLDTVLSPIGEPRRSSEITQQVFAGDTLEMTVRRRRKDGHLLDLEMHAVPLVVDGQVRGAFTIYKDISEQIRASEAERRQAESLSHLVQELQSRTNQMSLLSQMGDMLECCSTVKEAAAVVSQYVQKLFPEALGGGLYLFKASRNVVEAAAAWGGADPGEPCFSLESCWALRRGKPHWSMPETGTVNCTHLPQPPAARTLCLPMVGHDETLGVLELQFPASVSVTAELSPESVPEAQQQLASTVAGQVAFSLTSLRLRETLRDQSIRDPLTGLFNRRFMEESLTRELLRAARKGHSVSILFIDLDHFKNFNDKFGHDAGDMVLRSVSALFLKFFRSDDVCCRYGGEEFAIILPESASEYAAIRANQLRQEAKKISLQTKDGAVGAITMSIGVAAFPEDASNTEELLKVADRCLYQSKAGGRDAVTVATSPQRV